MKYRLFSHAFILTDKGKEIYNEKMATSRISYSKIAGSPAMRYTALTIYVAALAAAV
jgi:hypothetical protein